MSFNYFYGTQAESFSFFRLPRQLIEGAEFKHLSATAKLLYGLLLDRMGLSMKNEWFDDLGRLYIYYTVDEITEDLCCSYGKACELLAELDTKKGIGLIERKKQGQGKPTRIYVKNFVETQPTPKEESSEPTKLEERKQDCLKTESKKIHNEKLRLFKMGSLESQNANANYIDISYTDFSYTDLSISLSDHTKTKGGRDRADGLHKILLTDLSLPSRNVFHHETHFFIRTSHQKYTHSRAGPIWTCTGGLMSFTERRFPYL